MNYTVKIKGTTTWEQVQKTIAKQTANVGDEL